MKSKDTWTPYKIWNETEWYHDKRNHKMKIDQYSFGNIVINGRKYTSDVIVFPDRVSANWWRKEGHKIHIDDLKEVVKEKPKKVIIGTGASGMVVVPADVKEKLKEEGIEIEIIKTEEACRRFNAEEGIVAALHLTC